MSHLQEPGVVHQRRASRAGMHYRGAFREDPNALHARMRRHVLEDTRWRPEPPTMPSLVSSSTLHYLPSDDIRGPLEDVGLVKVRQERPATTAELIDLASRLGEVLPVPAQSDVVERHTESAALLHLQKELPATEAVDLSRLFSESALMFHTERAPAPAVEQPTHLLLACVHPPVRDRGNQTLFIETRSVCDRLEEASLRVLGTVRQGLEAYPIWSADEAVLRFRDFGSRPSAWFVEPYGAIDESSIEEAQVALLYALYSAPVWGIDWGAGDVVIVDNRRWLHGRSVAPAHDDVRHLQRVVVRAHAC